MAKVTSLSQPPYQFPLLDNKGVMTDAWTNWFLQLYQRVGGAKAVANADVSLSPSTTLINQFATASISTFYTSPAGQNTLIDSFTVTNNDSFVQTISIYVVPINQTPGASNLIVNGVTVAAGQSLTIAVMGNIVLSSGSYIAGFASAASALLVRAQGRQAS